MAATLVIIGLLVARTGEPERERVDAHCDIAGLEARAPDLSAVALDDATLLALGGEALADILEHCDAIDSWTEHHLRGRGGSWTPRIGSNRTVDFRDPPAAVLGQARRTCAGHYEQIKNFSEFSWREMNYAVFDLCEFETRGILGASDLEYIEPPELAAWRIHQLLLESDVPPELARRYFTAVLLACEIDSRARGAVRVHDGRIEVTSRDSTFGSEVVQLPPDGRLAREQLTSALDDAFDFTSRCISGHVTIPAAEPISNLRWLLDAEVDPERCRHNTLTVAIFEREHLLRPLRAELDVPVSGLEQAADLELSIDSSGAWRTPDGAEQGSDAAALAAVLHRLEPSSVRVRTNPSVPAAVVVDVLRVPDAWSARTRHELNLWLVLEEPGIQQP